MVVRAELRDLGVFFCLEPGRQPIQVHIAPHGLVVAVAPAELVEVAWLVHAAKVFVGRRRPERISQGDRVGDMELADLDSGAAETPQAGDQSFEKNREVASVEVDGEEPP